MLKIATTCSLTCTTLLQPGGRASTRPQRALITRPCARTTNGSKRRPASSIVTCPSRTTCGTGVPVAGPTEPARGAGGFLGQIALDVLQHLLRVLPHLDLGIDAANGAGGVDDEGGPVDAEELATEEALLPIDPVRGAGLSVGVAQEKKGQPVLAGEFLMRLQAV